MAKQIRNEASRSKTNFESESPSVFFSFVSNSNLNTGASKKISSNRRRRYSAEEKIKLLQEAEACATTKERTAFLKERGLHYSHLTTWRKQQECAMLKALSPKKRGPTGKTTSSIHDLLQRLNTLDTELEEMNERLKRMESLIMAIQKKR